MSIVQFVCAGLAAAVLVASLAAPAAAQTGTLVFERFDVEMTVLPSGDVQVVEMQTILFGGRSYSEGFATIPSRESEGVIDIAITENGQSYQQAESGDEAYTFVVETDSNSVDISWFFPDTENERRTFELSYTLKQALWRDPNGDQLTLTAIDPNLGIPVYASVVTVHLPAPLVQEPDSIGAVVEWETSADARTVTFNAKGGVPADEGLAYDLFMEHDPSAVKPEWQVNRERAEEMQQELIERVRQERERRKLLTAQINLWSTAIGLALLLAVPGALYVVWYMLGRDAPAGAVPDYLPEPPSALPPGLVGVLTDERADLRDISATLIDLARRGHVSLEDSGGNTSYKSPRSLKLHRVSEKKPEGLRRYESLIYDGLFSSDSTAKFDDLPYYFRSMLPQIESAMYAETVTEGLFRSSPGEARNNFQLAGIGVIIAAVVLGFAAALLWGSYTFAVILPALPVVGFGAGLLGLGPYMPARTRKGAEEAAKWRAFQKYLGNIKQYGNVAGVAEKFETFLPYAVAFGLERRWVNAFVEDPVAVERVPAPRWYRMMPLNRANPAGAPPPMADRPAMGGPASAPASVGSVPAPALPSAPSLNSIGEGMASGLNQMGQGFASALNTVGESLSAGLRPPAASGEGGGWGGSSESGSAGHYRSPSRSMSSSRRSFGSSRGSSGGRSSFRSGGGFSRSGGGGRRGFR